MNEMVERVAREMYALNEFVRDWDHPKTAAMWHDLYRRKAIAAIRAMREPTPRMLAAMNDRANYGNADKFKAVIDAALPEPPVPVVRMMGG